MQKRDLDSEIARSLSKVGLFAAMSVGLGSLGVPRRSNHHWKSHDASATGSITKDERKERNKKKKAAAVDKKRNRRRK